MARFRAFDSDSGGSDDGSDSNSEHEVERMQPVAQNRHGTQISHHVTYKDEKPAFHSEEEDREEEEYEEEEEEEDDGDEEESDGEDREEDEESDGEETDSGSSRMHEDELELSRSKTVPQRANVARVDSQRMHVMQTSLFRMPEEAAALKAMNEIADASLRGPALTLRKHGRESDGDIQSRDSRPSFAKDVQPTLARPTRKYTRVDSAMSVTNGAENAIGDAGLSFGRSFRVGWGPGGVLVRASSTGTTVLLSKTPIPPINTLSPKLLQHQLSHSPISPDEAGVPFASPSADLLHFTSFVILFSATDASPEASLFRLGSALFDPIPSNLSPKSLSPDVRNRVLHLIRKSSLSSWLQTAVAPSVQEYIQSHPAASPTALALAHLTGNQLESACEVAMDNGYPTLATLIAQAGGDTNFRADLRAQLGIWSEEKVDALIDRELRKIYALLAGELGGDVAQGLDWKRVFGLYLWFSEPMDVPIAQVYESFIASTKDGAEDLLLSLLRLYSDQACSLSEILQPRNSSGQLDYTIPWHLYIILSRCMRIRDFPDRGDIRVHDNGHLDQPEPEPEFEGHSPTADLLTSSYASQLEQLGMIQEAAFVLLHLEASFGRRKAIQDLLIRFAPVLDEWNIRGLVGSLKIPLRWVKEAQAIYALNSSNQLPSPILSIDHPSSSSHPPHTAYELFLAAGNLNRAHDIAVLSLAPDAVLRDDFVLLKELFSPFVPHSGDVDRGRVEGWYARGKAYLDYADIMTRIPALIPSESNPVVGGLEVDPIPNADRSKELEDLVRGIPRLISLLPDVLSLAHIGGKGRHRSDPTQLKLKHQVALHEMTARLVRIVDRVRPNILEQVQPQLLDEATKLQHIRAAAVSSFMKSIHM
ncbi:hypothetical protein D9757_004196 [Collybiopsis confluens]|uniref:Nuclear pore complex protein NUP96 C-terminal domain-containing protein n=1 Tax=Collybiopsis confluens TaxID=2823264 RepID=A0A8H5MD21_9AGAR|nr:hypothetical protein D9757_004196 [Collybiopsis confluens]